MIVYSIQTWGSPLSLCFYNLLSYRYSLGEAEHILVGDNFNKKINPRHMTIDHQAKSLQYFHSFAAKNRIPTNHLDDTQSRGDIADLPISTFLPTSADCSVLHSNFTILVSRIIVKYLPYSKEMKKPSYVVCFVLSIITIFTSSLQYY